MNVVQIHPSLEPENSQDIPTLSKDDKLVDRLDRPFRDLRISVTDRCNFRCSYCMPKEVFGKDYVFLPKEQLLTFEEITRIARISVDKGVKKIRITGGEPLLRKEIEKLIGMLAKIPNVELTMTTNASVLKLMARKLKEAGLDRVTVSLDAMNDEVFKEMNDVDFPVQRVLEGIEEAEKAGLTPIKINMVVKRGVNVHEIIPMASYFKGSGHILRFIEFMDVGSTNGWRLDDVLPSSEVVRIVHSKFPIEPIDPNYFGEVANRWRYKDGSGEIGLISSVTRPFCSSCTRARLSADGKLYTCLFAIHGFDLRKLLRNGATNEAISDAITHIWSRRTDRYSEIRSEATADLPKVEMSYIGG